MFGDIGKLMASLGELHKLPQQERVWLLSECKKLVAERLEQHQDPTRRKTLLTVMQLLEAIHIK